MAGAVNDSTINIVVVIIIIIITIGRRGERSEYPGAGVSSKSEQRRYLVGGRQTRVGEQRVREGAKTSAPSASQRSHGTGTRLLVTHVQSGKSVADLEGGQAGSGPLYGRRTDVVTHGRGS